MVKKLVIIFYILTVLLIAGFARYAKAKNLEVGAQKSFQETLDI